MSKPLDLGFMPHWHAPASESRRIEDWDRDKLIRQNALDIRAGAKFFVFKLALYAKVASHMSNLASHVSQDAMTAFMAALEADPADRYDLALRSVEAFAKQVEGQLATLHTESSLMVDEQGLKDSVFISMTTANGMELLRILSQARTEGILAGSDESEEGVEDRPPAKEGWKKNSAIQSELSARKPNSTDRTPVDRLVDGFGALSMVESRKEREDRDNAAKISRITPIGFHMVEWVSEVHDILMEGFTVPPRKPRGGKQVAETKKGKDTMPSKRRKKATLVTAVTSAVAFFAGLAGGTPASAFDGLASVPTAMVEAKYAPAEMFLANDRMLSFDVGVSKPAPVSMYSMAMETTKEADNLPSSKIAEFVGNWGIVLASLSGSIGNNKGIRPKVLNNAEEGVDEMTAAADMFREWSDRYGDAMAASPFTNASLSGSIGNNKGIRPKAKVLEVFEMISATEKWSPGSGASDLFWHSSLSGSIEGNLGIRPKTAAFLKF